MSIIQSLRDRAAWIISGAIAFALIVFVVEEGLRNKSVFGNSSNTLGKVNGTTIERQSFEEKMKRIEDNYARQYGQTMDENTRAQQRQALWNELADDAIMESVYTDLGLDATDAELSDYIFGPNPPQDLRQRFTNNEGVYDANQAYQTIQSIKKNKNSADYNSFFGEYMPAVAKFRKREKYQDLLANSFYVPKWLVEKSANENSQIATINFVAVPYTSIPDSAIKVTDEEITAYVNKNKAACKQEKAASIDFVFFSGAPNHEDTVSTINSLNAVRDSFATTTNVSQFLQAQGSATQYYDAYITRKKIQIPAIDSIIAHPAIYGPYNDGGTYVLSRVIASRNIPDSVNVRHILIGTIKQDQSTGQTYPIRSDEDAKKLADSIQTAIRSGANFDTLCVKFSDDDASKMRGGKYEKVEPGTMVPEFNNYIFENPAGSKGIVKTDFGYHYIEVLSQKGGSPAYKIAYFTKQIVTSDATANAALGLATQFAAESRDTKKFAENAKARNFSVLKAEQIDPLATEIPGVQGNAREMIRWIFNDASEGSVSEKPYEISGNYIVPLVRRIYKEGTKDAEAARPDVEFKVRQEKKKDMIAKKVGNPATLADVANALQTQVVTADSVSFGNPTIKNIGFEPKVAGAAFNKAFQAKLSGAIGGELGVYYLQTVYVGAVPNTSLDLKAQQAIQMNQFKMFVGRSLFETKRKAANIVDNRYKFF
jgi:peptidyl-prolyl cis-trans isomerase D